MPDTRTPGELAYGMYQRRLHNLTENIPLDYPRPFSTLSAAQRAAWEAAAQAVRAPAAFRYRLGQQVIWSCEPEAVWRITYRASHEDRAEGLRLYYGLKREGLRGIRMAEESELSLLGARDA